ncbi:MAG: N-acetylglutamate synthase-like GNAT family acetyltransferase [Roseivirga sp.]|jgi:N-acetylglutamate synthase-like GNAT family acetyltransferase
MWPDQPLAFIQLEGDENGIHFGVLNQEKLVSVASLFSDHQEAQFRKLAILGEAHGNGYANLLLEHVIQYCEAQRVEKLWCNARTSKSKDHRKSILQWPFKF